MKKRWRSAASLLLCGLLLVWFLADAPDVRAAVTEATDLCFRSVIPALFPVLVISSLLISLGLGRLLSRPLEGFMGPLYHLPGAASSALILGLLGGYPVGARTAAELTEQGLLTRDEGQRLLGFCNNSNPAFLVNVLGLEVFGSLRAGVWLWLIHVFSALAAGLLFRDARAAPAAIRHPPPPRPIKFTTAFVAAVRSGLGAMGNVAAFVVFFYVLAQPLSRLGGLPGTAAVGMVELFSAAPLLGNTRPDFILAAGLASLGGLSVLCQTAAVLDGTGLSIRTLCRGKLIQTLISLAAAALLAPWILG